ncbi:hypothetical protein AC579_7751 [Pseudocercospora musae]|uniref:Uncharacterized protein n=1 Tax=Pseudocercospora musae TaxID=113226 RepID=A0A139IKB3_9PEZI|nr:hypothetical protein AC579_7751 [Pseudocercospora musae]
MRLYTLPILAACVNTVLAGVKFTSPAAGSNAPSGTMTVKWEEDDTSPSIDQLTTYTIQLMVGGNKEGTDAAIVKEIVLTDCPQLPIAVLTTKGTFATGNSFQGTVQSTLAGPTKNGYYIKMMAVAKEGGQMTYFSNRFNIPTMTGTTPAAYAQGAAGVSGTSDVPETIDAVSNAAAGGAAADPADAGAYTVAPGLQTGLTKYAPMQSVPPTKITVKNFSPVYPTSPYTLATTFLPPAKQVTTITKPQTFSVSSMENTAAAQANPTDNMAKFLARWKD